MSLALTLSTPGSLTSTIRPSQIGSDRETRGVITQKMRRQGKYAEITP